MPRPHPRAAHPSAAPALAKHDDEANSYGSRMSRLRAVAGLKQREMGEVLGCDEFNVCKLEAGSVQCNKLRREIIDALERAFGQHAPAVVWGPRVGLTAGERLARIFAHAYPGGR